MDNSPWLKRLLQKTEKRKLVNITLWKILSFDKNFYNAYSLLWFTLLMFIFAYTLAELGFIENYFLLAKSYIQNNFDLNNVFQEIKSYFTSLLGLITFFT